MGLGAGGASGNWPPGRDGQPRRVGWIHDRARTPPAPLHRRDSQGPGRGGPQPPEGQAQAAVPGACARRRGRPGGLRRRHPDRRVPPRHRRGHPDDAAGAAGHGRLRAGRGHHRARHEAPAREPGRLPGRHPLHRRGPRRHAREDCRQRAQFAARTGQGAGREVAGQAPGHPLRRCPPGAIRRRSCRGNPENPGPDQSLAVERTRRHARCSRLADAYPQGEFPSAGIVHHADA